jgi:hypothetical protein
MAGFEFTGSAMLSLFQISEVARDDTDALYPVTGA